MVLAPETTEEALDRLGCNVEAQELEIDKLQESLAREQRNTMALQQSIAEVIKTFKIVHKALDTHDEEIEGLVTKVNKIAEASQKVFNQYDADFVKLSLAIIDSDTKLNRLEAASHVHGCTEIPSGSKSDG